MLNNHPKLLGNYQSTFYTRSLRKSSIILIKEMKYIKKTRTTCMC